MNFLQPVTQSIRQSLVHPVVSQSGCKIFVRRCKSCNRDDCKTMQSRGHSLFGTLFFGTLFRKNVLDTIFTLFWNTFCGTPFYECERLCSSCRDDCQTMQSRGQSPQPPRAGEFAGDTPPGEIHKQNKSEHHLCGFGYNSFCTLITLR